jgi:hypothetical protein
VPDVAGKQEDARARRGLMSHETVHAYVRCFLGHVVVDG